MHTHAPCADIIEGHPLIPKAVQILRRHKIPRGYLDRLVPGLFFAYPRTLWIKFSCVKLEAIPADLIKSETLTEIINCLLRTHSPFNRVVLDVRAGGERCLSVMQQLSKAQSTRLITIALESNASMIHPQFRANIFYSEKILISSLQQETNLEIHRIPLPEDLTIPSLDEALKTHATSKALGSADATCWDFSMVKTIDQEALTMLSPVIHSLAHSSGVLATVERVSASMFHHIARYGALRIVRSFVLTKDERLFEAAERNIYCTPMQAFTIDEAFQIQDRYWKRFDEIVRAESRWFAAKAKISSASTWAVENRRISIVADLIKDFRHIIKELVENVVTHSNGLGYICMEIDSRPSGGLFIYVGDTGIGLLKGVSRAYKTEIESECEAVQLFLRLVEKQAERRRHLTGALVSGGRGIARVSVILDKFDGQISVRSGSAKADFHPHKSNKPDHILSELYPIQGTHVHIFIPSPPYE